MNKQQALRRLEEIDREGNLIGSIISVLSYDFETVMPPKGAQARAMQMNWLNDRVHSVMTSDELGEIFRVLGENTKGLSDRQRALVRIDRRNYEAENKLPIEFILEFSEAGTLAENAWFTARAKNDFESFRPYLEKLVDLSRKKAEYLRTSPGQTAYDVLLNEYERGTDTEKVASLFASMQETIAKVMKMAEGKTPDTSFLDIRKYPVEEQRKFDETVVKRMGFCKGRTAIGLAHHPFTSSLGPDDVRITTRFTDPSVMDPFFSYVHEAGHGLYELGSSNYRTKGTSLSGGASMSMHESQSRMWENVFGHSGAFWEYWYPRFTAAFPKQTKGKSLKDFLLAINRVVPGDIRVNADEVTYSLHIILRFRLEEALINGKIEVKDLPAEWDRLSLELLGRKPDCAANGVLQDVHWTYGSFGYFPSYAIGNLINSQILYTMKKDLDVDALLREGRLDVLRNWLNDKIYRYGSIYESSDLLYRVTGEELNAKYFDRYLTEKYEQLYG